MKSRSFLSVDRLRHSDPCRLSKWPQYVFKMIQGSWRPLMQGETFGEEWSVFRTVTSQAQSLTSLSKVESKLAQIRSKEKCQTWRYFEPRFSLVQPKEGASCCALVALDEVPLWAFQQASPYSVLCSRQLTLVPAVFWWGAEIPVAEVQFWKVVVNYYNTFVL